MTENLITKLDRLCSYIPEQIMRQLRPNYIEVRDALALYLDIQKAVDRSSLAKDGMEMIEAAMRE